MIIVFGVDYCPYCRNSKSILEDKKIEHNYFSLENQKNQTLLEELRKLGLIPDSHTTVPVVINYKNRKPVFIGGNSELEEMLSK